MNGAVRRGRGSPVAWPIAARASLLASSAVVVLWALRQPPTADLAAQAYRAALFDRVGWVLWDNGWFGGHVLPGYSLVTPWLMANAGIALTGAVAATITTVAFAAIVRGRHPHWAWATAWVAWASAGDLLIGRVTYAIGLALAMLALLALARGRRTVLACVLAAMGAGASPVAGAFLALALAVWLTVDRDRAILAACACAGGVTVGCALLFGDGGTQPYSASSAAIAVAVAFALRLGLARDALLARRALLAYILAATACWALPSPMGSNIARLGVAFAVPLALVARRRVRIAYVAAVGCAAAVWLVFAPVTEIAKTLAVPNGEAAYFRPLLAQLHRRIAIPARVEVVPSATRWEAVHVGARYPLARGWETQLDRARNPLFYRRRFSAPDYVRWLRDNAVAYVALSRGPKERWGEREAQLLRRGLGGVRLAWASPDWRLYRVAAPRPLAAGARRPAGDRSHRPPRERAGDRAARPLVALLERRQRRLHHPSARRLYESPGEACGTREVAGLGMDTRRALRRVLTRSRPPRQATG